jgi:hypothetical protein
VPNNTAALTHSLTHSLTHRTDVWNMANADECVVVWTASNWRCCRTELLGWQLLEVHDACVRQIPGFLDFVNCSVFWKLAKLFGNWICSHAVNHCPKIEVGSDSGTRQSVSVPSNYTETDDVSETLCFTVFRLSDHGQRPQTWWFWVLHVSHRKLCYLKVLCIGRKYGMQLPQFCVRNMSSRV